MRGHTRKGAGRLTGAWPAGSTGLRPRGPGPKAGEAAGPVASAGAIGLTRPVVSGLPARRWAGSELQAELASHRLVTRHRSG